MKSIFFDAIPLPATFKQYESPRWLREAKFGIGAFWPATVNN